MTYMLESSAEFSDDRKYRYVLRRTWQYGKPVIAWIMLNPSTADEDKDDPTIRRCIGFSKLWNYGEVHIYNIFALRSTDPRMLYRTLGDIIGPKNNAYLESITNDIDIVCAWGNHGALHMRGDNVLKYLTHENKFFLKMSAEGQPCHPLYLPYNLPLVRFEPVTV